MKKQILQILRKLLKVIDLISDDGVEIQILLILSSAFHCKKQFLK